MKQDGWTHDELVIACRNIGYDLTCGQCASIFYTGSGTYSHTCLTWEDVDDEWTARIKAAHPTRSGSHETYVTAMRMVGARKSKHALVELVNWLLQR